VNKSEQGHTHTYGTDGGKTKKETRDMVERSRLNVRTSFSWKKAVVVVAPDGNQSYPDDKNIILYNKHTSQHPHMSSKKTKKKVSPLNPISHSVRLLAN